MQALTRWWFWKKFSNRQQFTRTLRYPPTETLSAKSLMQFLDAVRMNHLVSLNHNAYLVLQRAEMRGEIDGIIAGLARAYPLNPDNCRNIIMWHANVTAYDNN